jgi:hypothetical protein
VHAPGIEPALLRSGLTTVHLHMPQNLFVIRYSYFILLVFKKLSIHFSAIHCKGFILRCVKKSAIYHSLLLPSTLLHNSAVVSYRVSIL